MPSDNPCKIINKYMTTNMSRCVHVRSAFPARWVSKQEHELADQACSDGIFFLKNANRIVEQQKQQTGRYPISLLARALSLA